MLWNNNVSDGSANKYISNSGSNRFYIYTISKVIFKVELIIQ